MSGIIVDTSIWIDVLRSVGTSRISEHFEYLLENHDGIYVSSVTHAELWAGKSMRRTKAKEIVGELLSGTHVLYPDLEVVIKTGEILRESPIVMTFADAQIAATALVADMPLLTLNTKDFRQVKGIELVAEV